MTCIFASDDLVAQANALNSRSETKEIKHRALAWTFTRNTEAKISMVMTRTKHNPKPRKAYALKKRYL